MGDELVKNNNIMAELFNTTKYKPTYKKYF